MSKRAVEFLEEWVSENMVKPVAGAPEGDDSEARLRAEECLMAAKEEGIAKEDIEEEVGQNSSNPSPLSPTSSSHHDLEMV